MIFRVLIEGKIVEVARRKSSQAFCKVGILFDVLNLIAGNVDDIKCTVLEWSQRVVGRGHDLILKSVNGNVSGVPVRIIFLELDVGSAGNIIRKHERAVRQKSFRTCTVTARGERVIKFFIDGVKSCESHQRWEKWNWRIKFDDKSFRVGSTYAQSFRISTFDNGVGIFHASNGIAHDVGIFLWHLAMASPGENEIISSDGFAVSPFRVAEVESISLAVRRNIETFSNGGNGFAVGVELHQAINAIGDSFKRCNVGSLRAVEWNDIWTEHDAQLWVTAGRIITAAATCNNHGYEQQCRQ